MQAIEAIGAVVAVIASCLLGGSESPADLAGKGFRTGVCFIISFFKSFSFVFPIHDDPPEDEWSKLREERRVFFAGPPGQATHSSNKAVVFKKISFSISAKTAVLFSGIRLSQRKMPNQPW